MKTKKPVAQLTTVNDRIRAEEDGCVCLVSPGDPTVVQPLLSSHNDVESAAKVIWLHIHDLMATCRIKF